MEWRVAPPNSDFTTSVLNLDLGSRPIWWSSRPTYFVQTEFEKAKDWKLGMPLQSGATIVLKIPGSTGWSGRGETKYSGAYFQVLRVLRQDDHGNYVCEPIIDFPLRSK